MTEAKWPVIEYPTSGDLVCPHGEARYWRWHQRISLDLRSVTSAVAGPAGSTDVTWVGGMHGARIGVEYEDFMRDWMRARHG